VGYVLEGSVRRNDRRLRISGQLGVTSEAHLGPTASTANLSDAFELRNRITESVVAAIEPTLQFAEIKRHKRKRPNQRFNICGASDRSISPDLHALLHPRSESPVTCPSQIHTACNRIGL
jgi:hypothetical protein